MARDTREKFVSEPLQPVPGTADPAALSRGEPGLPGKFIWRGKEYVVKCVLESWKSSDLSCGELYLRRHWFRVETEDRLNITLYCLRQAGGSARSRKNRWWVYSFSEEN